MATVKEILDAAGGSYPSKVKEREGKPGWVDLNRAVRVIVNGSRLEGICLLNPSRGLAILNGSDDVVYTADFVIVEFQGRVTIADLTEDDMNDLETFLNIVADERTPSHDGSGQVQTVNAAAARVLISRFFMKRQKGLSFRP